MKAQIFVYKGHLGATTDLENGKFLNAPKEEGQLGCVVDTSEVQISKEAKELIRKAKRAGGSFSELMLNEHVDDSGSSVGLMGFGKHYFGTNIEIGRDCDLSVLDDMEEIDIEAPDDFKAFIDDKTQADVSTESQPGVESSVDQDVEH